MSYIGVPPFGQTVRTITEAVATAGQTTFTPSGGYLPGYIDVFLNGVLLSDVDFTATNGTTVVLASGAALSDEFKSIAYWPVSLVDTYRKGEVDSLLAGVGGGATGGGSDEVFFENGQTVTTNYTITTNKNAMSAGPITVDSGVTVTVPSGSVWTIV
jgi:hypothetical protein